MSTAPTSSADTILLVEDDDDMGDMLEFVLRQFGFKIVRARSVEEAQTATHGEEIGLIISDLGLPGASGLSLLEALGSKGQVPAIALSGYGSEEDVEASRAMGFAEHLVKPVMPDKLRSVVRRLLRL